MADRIVHVTYTRTMLDRVTDAATVPSTTLHGETLPPVVIDAIEREHLGGARRRMGRAGRG